MATVISALISAGVTLIVCLITNHVQAVKEQALLEYKLDELTKRVDKHNNLIERTFSLEKEVEVQKTKIENLEQKGV